MSAIDRIGTLYQKALLFLNRLSWLGMLLVRLTIGAVFVRTGWGKVHNLDNVIEFFTSLHIPAPGFHAVLVSALELVGGLALMVGLGSRLFALPLAFSMLIAIITAKRGDIEGVVSIFTFGEFHYLLFFLLIALAGPGLASLDHLIARRFQGRAASGGPAT